MQICNICSLKTKKVRYIIKGLIKILGKTKQKHVKSFKDHSFSDPFTKLINNILSQELNHTLPSSPCQNHEELKKKILNFLKIKEEDMYKRCQLILMSQIRSNYILDTIALKIRQFPIRIPTLIEDHKKAIPQFQYKKSQKDRKQQTERINPIKNQNIENFIEQSKEPTQKKQSNLLFDSTDIKIENTHVDESEQDDSYPKTHKKI